MDKAIKTYQVEEAEFYQGETMATLSDGRIEPYHGRTGLRFRDSNTGRFVSRKDLDYLETEER